MRHVMQAALAALILVGVHTGASAESFDYRPDILPDPFEPWTIPDEAVKGLQPWEMVALESIKVVGIISQTRDATARVIVDGEYFNIRVGMRLGLGLARVVRISGDAIFLQRKSIVDGKPVLQELALKL